MKNFVVYRSSAGSGKTFTLVREYLKLSLYDPKKLAVNYKSILAITFTNKAAAEMKSRVIDALDQIAQKPELPFVGKLLCDELAISKSELRLRAKILLSQILHHYSDLSIGTIDSFTHKIVKTFAFDLKLPVNFNIELDTRGFYEKVVAILFNKIGEDDYVGKLLKEFALSKAEANTAWDPEAQLREFSGLLQKENSGTYIEQLKKFNSHELEDFRKQFIDYTKHYHDVLKIEAQKVLSLITSNRLSDDDFYYKKSGPLAFFYKCLNNTVTLEETNGSRIVEAIEKNKWAGKGPNTALVEKISTQLTQIAVDLIKFIQTNHSYYSLCNLLSKQMYPLMLLKKIEEISAEQKDEESLVFISEFNQKIFEIIQNEPTPFIYERLGERYHHYLLDEFQDTSNLQWQNILPLIDNSLSNGWFNLLVGDGKQSIYRWRNASVKQFSLLPKIENPSGSQIIVEREESLTRNFEARLLNTNYRSEPTVVNFNNQLFEHLSSVKLLAGTQEIYKGHAQLMRSGNESDIGYVSIQTERIERDVLDESTCCAIKEHIEKALNDGYSYSDICILARKNNDGNTIANFLTKNKIPVISSDSLLLKNNLEINTLVSYLNYLVNNADKVSAAAVVNYLAASGRINKNELHHSLEQLAHQKKLSEILSQCGIELFENELSLNNLFDNCIAIVKAFELNARSPEYIRFFLDEVNEFLVLRNSNPSLFIEWWTTRSHKASLIIPEGTNAVRIMTIHASKGLEFPIVIVPYCDWPIYKAGESWVEVNSDKVKLPVSVVSLTKKAAEAGFEKEFRTEEQDQVLDNLNLLYVAFTRAIERLHIIAHYSAGATRESVANWLEAYLAHTGSASFYELGTRHVKQSLASVSITSNFALKPLSFNAARSNIRIKASYLNNSEPAAQAKRQGILVHWLLSKVRSLDDIARAINLGLKEGLLHPTEIEVLNEQLKKLISHPNLSPYFEPGINAKLEAELITVNGEVLRPDKIVFNGENTVIIDYKTGKPDNVKHYKQLTAYENALLAMGYKNIKKLLVYVDEPDIVELK